jgi:plasmid stabilization system protein ParE
MRVDWSPEAEGHVNAILNRMGVENPWAAEKWLNALLKVVNAAASFRTLDASIPAATTRGSARCFTASTASYT